jgi:uncharacterized protein YhaN
MGSDHYLQFARPCHRRRRWLPASCPDCREIFPCDSNQSPKDRDRKSTPLKRKKSKRKLIEAKQEIFTLYQENDKLIKEKKANVQELENKLNQREDLLERRASNLDKRELNLDRKEEALDEKKAALEEKNNKLESIIQQQNAKLFEIANYTEEQARAVVMERVETDMSAEISRYIRDAEENAKAEAQKTRQRHHFPSYSKVCARRHCRIHRHRRQPSQ